MAEGCHKPDGIGKDSLETVLNLATKHADVAIIKDMFIQQQNSSKLLEEELSSGDINKATVQRVVDTVVRFHKSTYVTKHEQLINELKQELKDDQCLSSFEEILKFNPDSLEAGHRKDAIIHLLNNDTIKTAVASLLEIVKNKKEALVHGRLNGESVIISSDQVKLTNGKNLLVGPCSLDIGVLLAQYLSAYHKHMLTEENNDWHRKVSYLMVEAANETVDRYLAAMGDEMQGKHKEFVSEVACFCGLEMIRRCFWSIACPSKSQEVLGSGQRLLNSYHRIHDVSRLTNIALMLTF